MLSASNYFFDVNQHLFEVIKRSFSVEECVAKIELLITNGADINSVREGCRFKNTIVSLLIANEDTEKSSAIISKFGSKINFKHQDSENKTILLLSVKTLKSSLVALILSFDTSTINTPDDQGRTPLHYACILGLPVIARMLISRGASFKIKDNRQLMPASYLQNHEEEISASLCSIFIDPRRHPLADFNCLMLGGKEQTVPTTDFAKSKLILSMYVPETQVKKTNSTLLLCAENFENFLITIDYMKEEEPSLVIDPLYLSMLYQIKKNPCTLYEKCLAGRKEVAELFNPVQSAQLSLKKADLNATFFFIGIAKKIQQGNEKLSLKLQDELKKLQDTASRELMKKDLIVYPDQAELIKQFNHSAQFKL